MAVPLTGHSEAAFRGRTVLVADDDTTIRDYLTARCRQVGLTVKTAADGLRTLLKVSKEDPDLLILDLNLPDVQGFRVCQRLTDPKFRPLPVIMLTASSDEETIRRCEEIGAIYLQKGPNLWEELLSIMRRIFDASTVREKAPCEEAKGPKVLLVDDDPVVLKALESRLAKHGINVVVASSGMQAFWLALRERPDAVLTDFYMEGGDAHYLLGRIKSTPATKHIPVIVCSGKMNEAKDRLPVERDLRGRGQAAEFLTKPVSVETLLASLRRHSRAFAQH